MGLLSTVKRILTDDYQKEAYDLIEKLGFTLNSFMDEVTSQINGNLDFSNLREEIKIYRVTVDSNGTPTTNDTIFTTVGNPSGVSVIKAVNQTSSTTYPTTAPWISFKPSTTSIKVLNIKGLQASNDYKLTLRICP